MLRKQQPKTLGALEAEGEFSARSNIKLEDVFYDLIDVKDFFDESNSFILVGGKGSGKTAFARMHETQVKGMYNNFVKIITKSEYDLEKVVQDIPDTYSESFHDHKQLFDWLIINQFIDMMGSHELIKEFKSFNELEIYKETNRGIVAVSRQEFVEAIKQFNGSVKVSALDKFISANFGSSNKFKYKKAEFTKVLPDLKRVVKLILNKLSKKIGDDVVYFTLIFDDLDQNFKNTQEHRDMLMNMLRIARDYTIFFSENENVFMKVVLLVRPDILTELDAYTDSFKIVESYKRQIEWFKDEEFRDNKKTSLREMINLRIERAFNPKGNQKRPKDAWTDLIDNTTFPQVYSAPSSFKWCLDRTRYRPRDIILFLNSILKQSRENKKITYHKINQLMPKYSSSLWREIKNELSFHFTVEELTAIETSIKLLGEHFGSDQFAAAMMDKTKYDPKRVLQILFDASVLGNKSGMTYTYKHRETTDEPIKVDLRQEFCINIGLRTVFR